MITAYYSFKGGVGRTLSVVHTALRLARGLARDHAGSVLVVDLDLEAPGLDPYLGKGHTPACGGLARLLERMRKRAPDERRAWLAKALTESRYVVAHPTLPLRYLPSGLGEVRDPNGPGYSAVAAWIRELLDEADGAALADLRGALADAATYTLVDSRTGLADESYLSTVRLADALVLLFRPSALHLSGVEQVYRNFLDHRGLAPGDPRAPVIPVLSPLPNRGGTDIARFLRKDVPRVFAWRWEDPPSTQARLDAPLEAVGDRRLVRLYEEPAVELGETTIVTEDGAWRDGFDADTPLPRGYLQIVDRLRMLNYRGDWRGADRLVRAWDTRDEKLSGYFLVERLRQRFTEDESVTEFWAEPEIWQEIVCPALAALPEQSAQDALAEAAAHLVMNTQVDGADLGQALDWASRARRSDVVAVAVLAVASRCQTGMSAELRETLRQVAERLDPRAVGSTEVGTAIHGPMSVTWWVVGDTARAAARLAQIGPDAFASGRDDARAWITSPESIAWALGASALGSRIAASHEHPHHKDVLAVMGWTERATQAAGDPTERARIAARACDVPALGAMPLPSNSDDDWVVVALRGGVPASVPPRYSRSPAARFFAALEHSERVTVRTVGNGTAQAQRNRAWGFVHDWLAGALTLEAPLVQADTDTLLIALADTFRIGTYAAARADHDTVGAAIALLERILAVAPGMGVLARRSDGGARPILLAAYHLHRLGRLSDETTALVNALRAPLDADVAPPEPPLDDLAAGYALDADRLQAAAALVGELPMLVHRLHEQATRSPTPG